MSARYEWDTDCADRELSRLERGFTAEDHAAFSAVLLAGFTRVQNAVHIETGRLRASGDADVTRTTDRSWHGHMSFGGAGVRWAASEFFGYSPKHGGYPSHAYYRVVGWQPMPRPGGLNRALAPARDVPGLHGIQDDMLIPVGEYISRGRLTPHDTNCPPSVP